jgi:4-diphosphocytidyl-2C-methyl-D-erythritol 2-phosphate synthase
VSALPSEKAFAKINLTLRVLGRRADGYHELESLVAFADVADALTLEPGSTDGLEMSGPFAGKSGPVDDNLVLKSLVELRRRIPGLKGGRFRLEKNLPVAAGIGGGSADAAAALRLLARANGIALDDSHLMTAAQSVGADVPVCLDSRPRIMRGIGEVLSPPLDLPPIPAILVNPGVALATREVFGKFKGAQSGPSLAGVPTKTGPLIELLKQQDNDLTVASRQPHARRPSEKSWRPFAARQGVCLRGCPDQVRHALRCSALAKRRRRRRNDSQPSARIGGFGRPRSEPCRGKHEFAGFAGNDWQLAGFPIVTGGMRGAP